MRILRDQYFAALLALEHELEVRHAAEMARVPSCPPRAGESGEMMAAIHRIAARARLAPYEARFERERERIFNEYQAAARALREEIEAC